MLKPSEPDRRPKFRGAAVVTEVKARTAETMEAVKRMMNV